LLARTLGQQMGLHAEALGVYGRTIELDPLYSFPYHNRGYSLLCVGNYAAAERDLRRALELEPRDHQAVASLVELAVMRGDTTAARELSEPLRSLGLRREKRELALARAACGDRAALALDSGPEVLVLLGEREAAMEELERQERAGVLDARKAATNPLLDPLRADDRLRRVLESAHRRHYDLARRFGSAFLEEDRQPVAANANRQMAGPESRRSARPSRPLSAMATAAWPPVGVAPNAEPGTAPRPAW
jgi:tetratricopeptide (TPR) repeat protein